jgi:hypothetical protein
MEEPKKPQGVILVGLDIPFGHLVSLLIEIAVASIPAAIILAIMGMIVSFFFAGCLAGLH